MSLPSLDLFTGIGGITHAFRGFCSPTVYCEFAPDRQEVLNRLMDSHKIERAPIHADVRTLKYTEKSPFAGMLIASFPCKGFSSVGRRQGFEHEETGLFTEVARLLKESQASLCFLENVPGVPSGPGLHTVLQAFDEAGYDANWLVLPAYAVGARQQRARWYCLGVHRRMKEGDITLKTGGFTRYDWSSEPEGVDRMNFEPQPNKYLSMLGNSVVPDAVRLAFMTLFTDFRTPPEELWTAETISLAKPSPGIGLLPDAGSGRFWGSLVNGVAARKPRTISVPKPDYNLQIDPKCYVHHKPSKADPDKLVTEPFTRRIWGSIRGGALGSVAHPTERTRGELLSMLRFEKDTPDHLRAGRATVGWISWLMGFPTDWFF